jgi:YidC/Oxa1 family membrane protein insertase
MEDKQNNLGTFIGLGLIFVLLYLWMQFTAPEEKPEVQQVADTEQVDDKKAEDNGGEQAASPAAPAQVPDSVKNSLQMAQFGAFAGAANGQEETLTLENDLVKIQFSTKGAQIKEVLLKNFNKIHLDTTTHEEIKGPLRIMADKKNRFDYALPVRNTASGEVHSSDLYYQASKEGNSIVFRAPTLSGGYFEQKYTLRPDHYELDYQLNMKGLENDLDASKKINFEWINYLSKLEINQTYERTMSSVYFKSKEGSPDYCNCRSDDKEELEGTPVEWFSHSNQFFNTTLIARNFSFDQFIAETKMLTDADADLKILKSYASLPVNNNLQMTMYAGPNEFDRLREYGNSMEEIIPFGSSIFGSINRWIIHPLFEFLSKFIGNKGVVILLLTFLVKLVVYPLTYRMVYSQAKMQALKPRIDELKKKIGDDQQKMSVETMKLYSEFGVNPLGSCFPIFLQMPIWFALYRFFPAAIEFRQASFLWATDLSSYDVAFYLPSTVPGFGDHISLFTLIWVVTTLWYSWYSMKQMDTSSMTNPAMKYVQYLMPVMFMFFFNSFASGLTAYLCFSNILNIGQTVVTKKFFINHDKIREKLEANKAKPKKEGGFRQRFEAAMKEQQRIQAEKDKQGKKKK